jgi:hypothetical protein
MQVQKRTRDWYTARRAAVAADPSRYRIMLIARSLADAAPHLEILHKAGFDVEFSTNTENDVKLRRDTRGIRLIVLLESDAFAGFSASEFLAGVASDLPCILLPAGASAEQAEVAVRTALRWTSVAHVSAAAAGV